MIIVNIIMELAEFFNQRDISDIKFTFSGTDKVLYAHKVLLMVRNTVFNKMFSTGLTEQTADTIPITCCSYEVFKYIVKYIYTQKYQKPSANIEMFELLNMVTMYDISQLLIHLDRHLVGTLANDSDPYIVGYACLMEKYNLPLLTELIVPVIKTLNAKKLSSWTIDDVIKFMSLKCVNYMPAIEQYKLIKQYQGQTSFDELVKYLDISKFTCNEIHEHLIKDKIFTPEQILDALNQKYYDNLNCFVKEVEIGKVNGIGNYPYNYIYITLNKLCPISVTQIRIRGDTYNINPEFCCSTKLQVRNTSINSDIDVGTKVYALVKI